MSQCNNKVNSLYRYSAFGIQIDSEIMLPELQQAWGGPADVIICYGAVPDKINVPIKTAYCYQAAVGEFLLRIDGIAVYYVTNGQQITIQPLGDANYSLVRLYLLGTAMGVLLMQRGLVPIHGSTVAINGCGVVFTGVSGAGKSTMAAALLKKGYSLLTDDVSAVASDQNGVFWVQPGYPQQKLWQDAASMIGIDTMVFDRICEDRDKYAVPISAGFRRLSIPITAVYEIVVKPCLNVSIVPIKGVAKLATIMSNTYRVEFVNGLGLKIPHFKQCANIVKQVQVFRLIRPEDTMSLIRQVTMMLQHFRDLGPVCSMLSEDQFVEEVRFGEKTGNYSRVSNISDYGSSSR
ncbi:HPr kinase/phosphorylase [Sporomusa ovata DSM 2662]|uniref:Serine kinase of the HPr protein, regulates carbohydrate metabolism n=2 Tax=Sporomusa ovata TaxID=2378 RepID=A0A0U1L6H2_9FIRM|nr:serine kinase of the HPr protein, regulates carbohydrate metabolism [Sporomusa ovata]EQB28410.1 serine kinase of the HPr protein, regulates carbohydrate metabolism [Sporomusa ovata DSM 2662]CQR74733.1 Serine kinase of the HPr protein, regulates carbohydrate metabolism [Sporomusa ovata]